MTFCKKCGQKNEADAKYCEECGAELNGRTPSPQDPVAPTIPGPAMAPTLPATTPSSGTKISGKAIKIAASALVGVVVISVGLYFLLASQAPSNELFAKLLEERLSKDALQYQNKFCLNNFPYDKDPVRVGDQDQGTQRWMAVLTKAGLYGEPEVVENSSMFFTTRQFVYPKTEAGIKATKGSRLCVADGVRVVKVEGFTPPQKTGETEFSKAVATIGLRNPMPWVQSPEANASFNGLGADFTDDAYFQLKDGKWVVTEANTIRIELAKQKRTEATKPASQGGGLGDFFKNLFSSSGSNPVIGKWKADVMGMAVVNMEFTPTTMIFEGGAKEVRYEVETGRVIVYGKDSSTGEVIQVMSDGTLKLNMGLGNLHLTRLK
jgi:hypothetical protein